MISRFSPYYPIYLWTQRALPLVISGDLEIIDLVRHLMTSISEIAEGETPGTPGEIDYNEIIRQIIDNESFYEKFKEFINNYLVGVDGTGNIIGYLRQGTSQRYSLGITISDSNSNNRGARWLLWRKDDISKVTYPNYVSIANMSGHVFFTVDISAGYNPTTSLMPDGNLEWWLGFEDNRLDDTQLNKWYDNFVNYTNKPFYSMPYGDPDNYFMLRWNTVEEVKIGRTAIEAVQTTAKATPLITLYTSGQAFRSLPGVNESSIEVPGSYPYRYATFATTYFMENNSHEKVSNADIVDYTVATNIIGRG